MLAAPLGGAAVIGVDPGLRTGCKCAAIDATGKFLGTITIYISQGDAQARAGEGRSSPRSSRSTSRARSRSATAPAAARRRASSSGRSRMPADARASHVVSVNEAGASVYSASDLAREEFPELDLTIRGAISIARRLQDPLAELVKIEPKSIGVGQYQHDVQESLLAKRLGDVVESCVNHVGVELNTASAQLLGYVAGIGKSLAKKIVLHRDAHGAFASRGQLQDVTGLGPKAFEQAAGFLRIRGARESARCVGGASRSATRSSSAWRAISAFRSPSSSATPRSSTSSISRATSAAMSASRRCATSRRSSRSRVAIRAPSSRRRSSATTSRTMEDLKPGMVLEGVVTNVTAFGAFVDIGVHNDGLVHVSQLAEQFVKDPSEVVKVGQRLKVRVLEIDHARKRIALSARPPQQRQPRNDAYINVTIRTSTSRSAAAAGQSRAARQQQPAAASAGPRQ